MVKRSYLILCALLFLAGIGLRLTFFAVSVSHLPASADESITVLQAKGIVENGNAISFQAKQYPRGIRGRFPLLFMAEPYMFPIESYAAAPFVKWLPRNALGARIIPFAMGILTAFCSVMILLRRLGRSTTWTGLLLILFPSAYFLMLQSAYGLPGYSSLMLLCALVVLIAVIHDDAPSHPVLLALAAGLLGGLACSGLFMALPVVIMAGLMIGLGRNWRTALHSMPAFVIGFLAGMIPYLVAKKAYPGAFGAVSGVFPKADIARRLLSPTLDAVLPAVVGFRTTIFPDNKDTITAVAGLDLSFTIVWSTIMIVATAVCLIRFFARLIRNRWPSVTPMDVFVGVSWMGLILFAASRRSHSTTFRYLLLLAWSFPFIVAFLYAESRRVFRVVLGLLAVSLALLNTATAARLIMRVWRQDGFADRVVQSDLKPAIDYLRERGIDRCYATYQNAYRIDFETDESILCSQPYNERFYGWPLPYKEAVLSSTNVAYVLTAGYRLLPDQFEKDMATMGITFEKASRGPFSIYSDFREQNPVDDDPIPGAKLKVSVPSNPEGAPALTDGDYATRWSSRKPQQKGMAIEIALPQPTRLTKIALYYNFYYQDRALSLTILVRAHGTWRIVRENIACDMDPCEFINGHPDWGNQLQSIRLPGDKTDGLRIEIDQPASGRDWTIGEIRLLAARQQG